MFILQTRVLKKRCFGISHKSQSETGRLLSGRKRTVAFLFLPFASVSLRVVKNVIRVFGVCVWPTELNCCIPASCTQVLLNLPSNIDLLSKQL